MGVRPAEKASMSPSMKDPNRVIVFDTTMRDGEQSPGASMNLHEKLEIARMLEALGVDVIVDGRHQLHRPMLFTTNKPTAQWGDVLHDHQLAEAILDRVLERGAVIEMKGKSYRTKHHKPAAGDA